MVATIGSAGAEPVEIELKFQLPVEARALLERHPAFAQTEGAEAQHQVSAYFDTADLALARKGISLRVRRSGERRIQTVKLAGLGNGIAVRRGEWEWPIEQDDPDFGLLARTPVGSIDDGALAAGVEPVFVTDIHRTIRRIDLDGGTVVEAALDEGAITAGTASEPVSELELELKCGTPGPLYRFALLLHATVPFTIESESKAARGYRLKTGAKPTVAKAAYRDLGREAGAADGMRQIIGAALGHLLANEPTAAIGDAEGVHQMRVAIRRLRAALVLFEPHLEPHAAGQFEAELKRLGRIFGTARDWDVFCLETLPRAEREAPAKAWIGLLRPRAEAQRQAAHRALEGELGRPALTGLVLGMAAWIEAAESLPGLLGDKALRGRLSDLAPRLLDGVARKVAKRGRHIGRHSPEELHALRKSLKKLRYSVDYLAGLYGRRAVKAYLRGCKDLQKRLGDLNDASVAIGLAEELGRDQPGTLAPAIAGLATWSEQRQARTRRRLAKTWADFKSPRKFWP